MRRNLAVLLLLLAACSLVFAAHHGGHAPQTPNYLARSANGLAWQRVHETSAGLKADPDNQELRLTRALALMKLGLWSQASDDCDACQDSAAARYLAACAQESEKGPGTGEFAALVNHAGADPEGRAVARLALHRTQPGAPSDLPTVDELERVQDLCEATRELPFAEQLADRLLGSSLSADDRARVLECRGDIRLGRDHWAEARDDYSQALAHGEDARLYAQRAWVSFLLGDLGAQTWADLDRSLTMMPSVHQLHTRARLKWAAGDLTGALADLDQTMDSHGILNPFYHEERSDLLTAMQQLRPADSESARAEVLRYPSQTELTPGKKSFTNRQQ